MPALFKHTTITPIAKLSNSSRVGRNWQIATVRKHPHAGRTSLGRSLEYHHTCRCTRPQTKETIKPSQPSTPGRDRQYGKTLCRFPATSGHDTPTHLSGCLAAWRRCYDLCHHIWRLWRSGCHSPSSRTNGRRHIGWLQMPTSYSSWQRAACLTTRLDVWRCVFAFDPESTGPGLDRILATLAARWISSRNRAPLIS